MLDCLKGLVDLDDTCGITPDPGAVRLQALGITGSFLSDITGREEDAGKLLTQVEEWARAYIASDLQNRMGAAIATRTILDRQLVGDPEDGSAGPMPAGHVGGMTVTVDAGRSNLSLSILTVRYYGTPAPGETITVHDLSDGTQVYTAPLAATNTINITVPAHRRKARYFISHGGQVFSKVVLGGACCGHAYSFGALAVEGGTMLGTLPYTKGNVQKTSHTFGLTAVLTIACDHAALLCEIRGALQMPYLYKIGQGIMDRAIQATGRMNNTTLDRDLLVARAAQYEKEYQRTMEQTLRGMVIPCSDPCFHCAKRTASVVSLP